MEEDDDNRFPFVRIALVDQPVLENRMSEEERIVQDVEVAKNEHERETASWIEQNVPWNKLFTKR